MLVQPKPLMRRAVSQMPKHSPFTSTKKNLLEAENQSPNLSPLPLKGAQFNYEEEKVQEKVTYHM